MVFLALIRSALAIAALLLLGPSYSEAAEREVAAYEWPTAGWRVSTPEEQGMDSAALADLVDFGASRGLNSLLVARHGMIVVEAFYAPFRAGLKHRTRSVTKSVIGTLVGIAVKEGRLDSLDRPVVEFFPDRQIANLDERKRAITIQHLLDMTSGLDWNEESFVPAMHHSNDWTQFVIDRPMAASPGTGFLYNSGSSHKLKAALGGPADVVLSDMAAPATGHSRTDHIKIIALAEAAHAFATEVLKPGGAFIAKVLQGGATQELLALLKRDFAEVRHVKPAASRADWRKYTSWPCASARRPQGRVEQGAA